MNRIKEVIFQYNKIYKLKMLYNVMNKKYLCWDVDGTLYKITDEMDKELYTSIVRVLKNKGKNLKESDVRRVYNKYLSYTRGLQDLGINGKEVMSKALEYTDFSKYVKFDSKLLDMFVDLSDYKHSIITSGRRDQTFLKLGKLGLMGLFNPVIAREDSGHKITGEPFRDLVKFLQTKPENIYYIGDNLKTDIIPAKKERFKTIYIGNSKEADYNIEIVYNIPKLLRSLE